MEINVYHEPIFFCLFLNFFNISQCALYFTLISLVIKTRTKSTAFKTKGGLNDRVRTAMRKNPLKLSKVNYGMVRQ